MLSIHSSTIIKNIRFPTRQDLPPFFLSLFCLLLNGTIVWLFSFFIFSEYEKQFQNIAKPDSFFQWLHIVLLCLWTGYWEEGVFRVLPIFIEKRFKIKPFIAIALSALLFTLFHRHEGFLGMVNAAGAALLLSAIYLKYKSYHGIALPHTVYNIIAYILFNSTT